jgi:hypothetical protein
MISSFDDLGSADGSGRYLAELRDQDQPGGPHLRGDPADMARGGRGARVPGRLALGSPGAAAGRRDRRGPRGVDTPGGARRADQPAAPGSDRHQQPDPAARRARQDGGHGGRHRGRPAGLRDRRGRQRHQRPRPRAARAPGVRRVRDRHRAGRPGAGRAGRDLHAGQAALDRGEAVRLRRALLSAQRSGLRAEAGPAPASADHDRVRRRAARSSDRGRARRHLVESHLHRR